MTTTTHTLTGKVAVMTGGSSGIGFAAAQQLVAAGAYIFSTGRRQDALEAAVAQLGHSITGAGPTERNKPGTDQPCILPTASGVQGKSR